MDTTTQIDDVERAVATRERDGGPTKVVTVSQTYPVGVADLWDACTRGERISRWLIEARPGAQMPVGPSLGSSSSSRSSSTRSR